MRHVISRGDVAAISVTVHVATLSWSKSRTGYLKVLRQIEPQVRALLAPRIFGFDAGSNLSAMAQWTTAMRGLIPWSFVHLPNLNFDFWRVGALGVRSMGLSVGSLAGGKTGGKTLAAEVDKLVRICASQKAVPYTACWTFLHPRTDRAVPEVLVGDGLQPVAADEAEAQPRTGTSPPPARFAAR